MSGYCKYCDSLVSDEEIVKAYSDEHRLVWVGCLSCYQKRIGMLESATVTQ